MKMKFLNYKTIIKLQLIKEKIKLPHSIKINKIKIYNKNHKKFKCKNKNKLKTMKKKYNSNKQIY